jgi:hypothetical protein
MSPMGLDTHRDVDGRPLEGLESLWGSAGGRKGGNRSERIAKDGVREKSRPAIDFRAQKRAAGGIRGDI